MRRCGVLCALTELFAPHRPADNFAYAATVDSYDSAEGTHCVTYADGTEEWVRVGQEECYVQLAPGEEPPLLSPAPPAGGAPQSEAQAERAVVEGLPGGVPEGLDAVGTRLSVHFPATLSWFAHALRAAMRRAIAWADAPPPVVACAGRTAPWTRLTASRACTASRTTRAGAPSGSHWHRSACVAWGPAAAAAPPWAPRRRALCFGGE